MVTTAHANLLERSTVSLHTGDEDPLYPLYRLYDRNVGRQFRASSAAETRILVAQDVNELVTNGGFETGDFTGHDAQSAVIESGVAHSGSYCARLTAAGSTVYGPMAEPAIVDAASVYNMTAFLRVDSYVSGSFMLRFKAYSDEEGASFNGNVLLHTISADTGWTGVTKTIGPAGSGADAAFPSGTKSIRFQSYWDTTPNGTAYIDGLSLYRASELDAVDRLIIPAGHALAGASLSIEYSDNGDSFGTLDSWTGQDGAIDRAFTPATHRYWRFSIEGPADTPALAELFLSAAYEWERAPVRPLAHMAEEHNVAHSATASGGDRFLVMGPSKRRRRYVVPRASASQAAMMQELNASWGGAKPFWLMDHDGQWIFVRLHRPLEIGEVAKGSYSCALDMLEVLP